MIRIGSIPWLSSPERQLPDSADDITRADHSRTLEEIAQKREEAAQMLKESGLVDKLLLIASPRSDDVAKRTEFQKLPWVQGVRSMMLRRNFITRITESDLSIVFTRPQDNRTAGFDDSLLAAEVYTEFAGHSFIGGQAPSSVKGVEVDRSSERSIDRGFDVVSGLVSAINGNHTNPNLVFATSEVLADVASLGIVEQTGGTTLNERDALLLRRAYPHEVEWLVPLPGGR